MRNRKVQLLRRPCFPRENARQSVTWSSRVNFEDILIAEANSRPDSGVDSMKSSARCVSPIQAPTSPASPRRTCDDHGRDSPPDRARYGSQTDARLLERDNVKRFDTIYTEIRTHSSSMKSRISSKSSGVERQTTPRTRLVAIFLEIRLPDASANLASISSANLRRSRM